MKLSFYFLFTLIIFFSWPSVNQAFAQIDAEGINAKGKSLSYAKPETIEIDTSLKVGKDIAPFDRTFFLKIKRPAGNSISGIRTKVVNNPPPNANTAITDKFEVRITETGATADLANPKSVSLSNISKSRSKKDLFAYVKTEPDCILIMIEPLMPEQGYKIEIEWEFSTTYKIKKEYNFSTVAPSLDKRLKNYLSPQIGLSTAFFKLDNGTYTPVSLVVGAHYHPRPVDPDLPNDAYKALALQRFSIFLGLTINSMADNYIREDLFGTSNILVGVGYKPFKTVRLTAGGMMFKEVNPNRLLSNRKSIAMTSYVGITLGLELKSLLGGIITTLGFK